MTTTVKVEYQPLKIRNSCTANCREANYLIFGWETMSQHWINFVSGCKNCFSFLSWGAIYFLMSPIRWLKERWCKMVDATMIVFKLHMCKNIKELLRSTLAPNIKWFASNGFPTLSLPLNGFINDWCLADLVIECGILHRMRRDCSNKGSSCIIHIWDEI